MMVNFKRRHLCLQASIILMLLLAGNSLGLDYAQQNLQNVQNRRQDAPARVSSIIVSNRPAQQVPTRQPAQQAQQEAQKVQKVLNQSLPRDGQQQQQHLQMQMQLGGKCASKGSCSREMGSRRLDLDSGPDKQACYCDQLCATYDDCCRDSRWAEPPERRLELGAEKLKERRKMWQCRRISDIFGDVLLRATCQSSWLASQPRDKSAAAQVIKQRCESSEPGDWQESDPLGSLMPITDLTTGITYANSYCLRCNPNTGSSSSSSGSTQKTNDTRNKQQKQKLIYWSPVVNCNYNSELDDRNALYDLISLKKGQALRYSRQRNKWLLQVRQAPQQGLSNAASVAQASNASSSSSSSSSSGNFSTSHSAPPLTDSLIDINLEEDTQGQRVCSIQATIPNSVEHLIRHCRARMISSCPPQVPTLGLRQTGGGGGNEKPMSSDELQQARAECHLGHQSLVYSQTSDLVYFNLACAKCNRERQVFCEPRLSKHLSGQTPASSGGGGGITTFNRNTAVNAGQRVFSLPGDPLIAPSGGGGGAPSDNQLDTPPIEGGARSGGDLPGQGSFSVLMDLYGGLQGDGNNEQVGAIHRCEDAERQVYDPFLLTCRDIVCGLNHRFLDGSCVQVEGGGSSGGCGGELSSNLASLNLTAVDKEATSAASQDGKQALSNIQDARNSTTSGAQHQVQVVGASNLEQQVVVVVSSSAAKEDKEKLLLQLQRPQPTPPKTTTSAEDQRPSSSGKTEDMLASESTSSTTSSIGVTLSASDMNASNVSSKTTTTTAMSADHVDARPALVGGSYGAPPSDPPKLGQLSGSSSGGGGGGGQAQALVSSGESGGQHKTTKRSDNNDLFSELLASLELDALPQPTSESRRAFAECAKILIEPEQYRLFSVADLLQQQLGSVNSSARNQASEASTLTKPGTLVDSAQAETTSRLMPASESDTASQPQGTNGPDVQFVSASEHQRRATSLSRDLQNRQNIIWALVSPYNLTLASSQFELVRARVVVQSTIQQEEREDFKLLVCSPFKSDLVAKFKPTMVYLTTCCLAVSITSLVLFLLLYGLSTFDLRHLVIELTQAGRMSDALKTDALDSKFRGSRASSDTSYNAARSQSLSSRGVACLATALLIAYLLFILGHQQQQQQQQEQQASTTTGMVPTSSLTSCTIIAAATYCSFLMAFNWMFLLSYDIWRTLRLATCQLRTPTMNSQSRRFAVYALCACGAALSLTMLALVVDQLDPPINSCSTSYSATLHAGQAQTMAATCSTFQAEVERLLQFYRPKFGRRAGSCWFSNRRSLALFFGLPVTLIMFVNLLFFLHSSYMVIKTSSRSSRRLAATTNSNCSTNNTTSTEISTPAMNRALNSAGNNRYHQQEHQQHQQQYLSDQMLDYAQQNGMTTSSISSVQTIQSNLSLRSESDFGSDESTSSPGGATRVDEQTTPPQRDMSETDESESGDRSEPTAEAEGGPTQETAAIQIQIQIQDQIDKTSRQLSEREQQRQQQQRQQHYCATRRLSFRNSKQESSSSLISAASSRSLSASNPTSLASNLAQKYDQHLNNLSSFVSSIVKDYRLYCRLSTIMGLTWLTGLMASVVDQSELLWYLFVVLNTLQGLFIFVAFGFKRSRLTNVEILFDYLRFKLTSKCLGVSAGQHERPTNSEQRPAAAKGGDF